MPRRNDDKAPPSDSARTRAEPRATASQPPTSSLWPSAGDSSSGLRDTRTVAGTPQEGVPRVGPFELLSPIGSTAYGRAFRARRQEREVALHFLTLEDDREGTLASALRLAVARCAQLSHPNVIAVEQQGRSEEDGSYYLITEVLDGVSLAAALDDSDAFPLPRALQIVLQIGRALRAAHKLGIVHGALSPANVRLSQVQGGELVRVVGFDCATLSPHSPALTGPYQAPERASGKPPDMRADIFALGSLLYRMLAGETPTVESPAVRAPLLSSVSREPVPRVLDELVARCLEPDPSLRQGDLTSLMRGLREVARELNLAGLDDRMTPLGAPSLPPADATFEADAALFAGETNGKRGSAAWILAGLLLALAAVWLVWEASSRVRPEVQEPRSD